MEDFEKEFRMRFNADLMTSGEAVRMGAMKLNRGVSTRPTANKVGPLPEPTFGKVTVGAATFQGRARVDEGGRGGHGQGWALLRATDEEVKGEGTRRATSGEDAVGGRRIE